MKKALIKQPIGLGDIFYLQKFAFEIRSQGYEIIWPLRDDIMWVSDYISEINFCPLSDNFLNKDIYYSGMFKYQKNDFLFLSPDGYHIPGKTIMESKYSLIDCSDKDWFDYFTFNRNTEKENKLYYDILNLQDNSDYIFINKMASIDIRYSNVLDNLNFSLKTIELKIIPEFTLFDWCKVLENAIEIHTVHTGINYIIDKLNIKAVKYNMYQGLHHNDVQFIPFQKNPCFIPN